MLLYNNNVYGAAGEISPQASEAAQQRPLSPVIPLHPISPKQFLKPKPDIDSPITAWGTGTANQERAPASATAAKTATVIGGGLTAAEETRGMRRGTKVPAGAGTFARARPVVEARLPAGAKPAAARQPPASRQFPAMPMLNLAAASPRGLSPQTSADVRYATEGLGKPVALQPRRSSADPDTAVDPSRALLSPRASLAGSRLGKLHLPVISPVMKTSC